MLTQGNLNDSNISVEVYETPEYCIPVLKYSRAPGNSDGEPTEVIQTPRFFQAIVKIDAEGTVLELGEWKEREGIANYDEWEEEARIEYVGIREEWVDDEDIDGIQVFTLLPADDATEEPDESRAVTYAVCLIYDLNELEYMPAYRR